MGRLTIARVEAGAHQTAAVNRLEAERRTVLSDSYTSASAPPCSV